MSFWSRPTISPTSTPARQGSMITTSGPSLASSARTASSSVVASLISAPFQAASITARIPARTTGWSSTMRQRGASCEEEAIGAGSIPRMRMASPPRRNGDEPWAGSPLFDADLTRFVQLEPHGVDDRPSQDDDREDVEPHEDDHHEDESRPEAGDRGDVVEVGGEGGVDDSDGHGRAGGSRPDRPPGDEPVRHRPVDDAQDPEQQQEPGRERQGVDQVRDRREAEGQVCGARAQEALERGHG